MSEIDLEALAAKVEALEGPCRETDQDIHELIVIESALSGTIYPRCKKYTASIDAAMSLCLPNWWVDISAPLSPDAYGYSREDQRMPRAGMQCVGEPYSSGARAATLPLAICAMALKARASLSRLSPPPTEVKDNG